MKATNKSMRKSKASQNINKSTKQISTKKTVQKVTKRTFTLQKPLTNLKFQSQSPSPSQQLVNVQFLSFFQPQLRSFSTNVPQSQDPFQQAPPLSAHAPGKFPFQPKKFTPSAQPPQQFNFNAKKTLNQTNDFTAEQNIEDLDPLDNDDSGVDHLEFEPDSEDINADGEDKTCDQSTDSDLPISYKRIDNLSSDSELSRDPLAALKRLPLIERQQLTGVPTMLHPDYRQHDQTDAEYSTESHSSFSGSELGSESNSEKGKSIQGKKTKSSRPGEKSGNEGPDQNASDDGDKLNSEENEFGPYKGTSTMWKKTSSKDITLQEGRPFYSDIEGPLMFSDDPFYAEEEKPYEAFYNDAHSSSGELISDDFETMGTSGLLQDPSRMHELLDVVTIDDNMKWLPGKKKIQLPCLKPGRPIPKGWMVTESGHCVPETKETVHHKYADPDLYQTPAQERLRDVVQAKLPQAFKLTPAEQESFMEVTQTGHHGAYTRHRERVLNNPVINSVVAKINARRGDPKINDFDQNIDLSIELQNVSPFIRKYKHDFSAQGHAFLDIPKSTIDLIRNRKRSPHRLPGPSMDFSFQNTAYHKATH